VEREIAEVVQKHGWYALSVYDNNPPFLYSVGLMQSFKHPELIVLGLEPKSAYNVLCTIVSHLRTGSSYVQPGKYPNVLEGGELIAIRRVHPTQHPLYLGYAMGYCRETQISTLEAVQVLWPDGKGKFPFDVGCDNDVFQLQPRLDIPLTQTEQEEFERQWGSDG
jgi:hypothetical protein